MAHLVVTSELEDDDCEDLCFICSGEENSQIIYLQPCNHTACAACIQKLRLASIYKPDKGILCPFCRQTVADYKAEPSEKPKPARKSPGGAAPFRAREGGGLLPPGAAPFGRGGVVSIGNQNDYFPPKSITGADGGGLRFTDRPVDFPPGYVVPNLKETDDIHTMAYSNKVSCHLVYHLQRASPKRHKYAKQIFEALVDSVPRMAVHPCGNYVLQAMFAYASAHRAELGPAAGMRALVRSFASNHGIVTAGMDKQGHFSIQKMVLVLRGTEEMNFVLTSIKGHVERMALDQYGYFVIERIVEALVTSVQPPPGRKPCVPAAYAEKALSFLSRELTATPESVVKLCSCQVRCSGLLIVECIRFALPDPGAVSSARAVANLACQLAGNRSGNRVLQGILSFEEPDLSTLVEVRLRGRFKDLALDSYNQGFRLVRAFFATYSLNNNLKADILDELIDGITSIMSKVFASETLAFGLSLLPKQVLDNQMRSLNLMIGSDLFTKLAQQVLAAQRFKFSDVAYKPAGGPAGGLAGGPSSSRGSLWSQLRLWLRAKVLPQVGNLRLRRP